MLEARGLSLSSAVSSQPSPSETTDRMNNDKLEDRGSIDNSGGDSKMVGGWEKRNDSPFVTPFPISAKRTYREAQFDRILRESVVNIVELRKLGWNGIPPQHRPIAWKILLGYLPTNSTRRAAALRRKRAEYLDAVAQHHELSEDAADHRTQQEQETLRQVLVDVPRTAPDVALFRNEGVRRALERLLHVWAVRHPASSYVQGINDLATPLLAVFLSEYCDEDGVVLGGYGINVAPKGNGDAVATANEASALEILLRDGGGILGEFPPDVLRNAEADCYWCLTNLLAGIQDHYTSDQPGVQRMVMRLQELVHRIDSSLARHLKRCGVEFMQFAFRWMNCLLLREFELKCVVRLWDTYLSEGDGGFEGFHVYVCAAFLCQFSDDLKRMEFDEIFGFLQNTPTSDWADSEIEILLSQAFVLSTLFQGSDAHLMTPQG